MNQPLFEDRAEAGAHLSARLADFEDKKDTVVLGLPRGGVVVAATVAKALNLPLEVLIARKIGAPGDPEFAIGAVGEGGEVVLAPDAARRAAEGDIARAVERELREAKRRVRRFRGRRKLDLRGKTVILVDDGVATGHTMAAAIRHARALAAREVVVAAPVIAAREMERLASEADRVVCVEAPDRFGAVGGFYAEFPQIEDEEVADLLRGKNGPPSAALWLAVL